METKALDKWLVSFIEENSVTIIATLAFLALVQWIWWLKRSPPNLLAIDGFHHLKLIKKENVNHNTRFFRFGFDNSRQRLGLPTGRHLVFRMTPAVGEPVSRKYTPVSSASTRGHVDFVIKIYPQGLMSQYLDKLKIGQRMSMKGPRGKFTYKCNMKKSIGMLAGGTGITPMYQVFHHILNDPRDTTQIRLIYANITPSDILLRQDLDALVAKHPKQFDVYYVIEKNPPLGWKYGTGYITAQMIREHCPAPSEDSMILLCGPPPMVEAMKQLTTDVGYAAEATFKF